MDLSAEIKGVKYTPLLCKKLKSFQLQNLSEALSSCGSFILNIDENNKVAVSWWVSPKRTRSYPYARVYDTLGFCGKKITIIPVVKDEGKDGDRDFLQWDTISLMSLLGVYVIVAYYVKAEKSGKYRNKITNQCFDISYIEEQIKGVLSYQSDALHWNLNQIENIGKIGQKALEAYDHISKKLKVKMHSWESAKERLDELLKGKNKFMELSRALAEKAQRREQLTIQPKENLAGTKAVITIQNYLGGVYYLTVDEVEIEKDNIFLIEGKHSKRGSLPSLEDIKDGLIKMILFANLENVKVEDKSYKPIAALKLTASNPFDENKLSTPQKKVLEQLREEAELNGFQLRLV